MFSFGFHPNEVFISLLCTSINMGSNVTPNTVARLQLNSETTTQDSSGKGNSVNNSGATFTNNGAYLNGSSYLTFKSNLMNGYSEWTIAFWIKPSSSPGVVLARQYNGQGSGPTIILGGYQGSGGSWTNGTANYLYVATYNGGGRINSNQVIANNGWKCVVITGNSSQAKMYINGTLVQTVNGNFTIQNWNGYTGMWIGQWGGDGGGHYFTGYIGNFVIENKFNDDSFALNFYNKTKKQYS